MDMSRTGLRKKWGSRTVEKNLVYKDEDRLRGTWFTRTRIG